jgi:hypothetical protein
MQAETYEHKKIIGSEELIDVFLRGGETQTFIRDLYSMNIDSASLFPGFDGFARSLRYIVRSDEFTGKG